MKIPFCLIDNLAPAGSISSSVNDMSHWVTMQLNNGKYEDQQVVPMTAIAQTRLPHSILGKTPIQSLTVSFVALNLLMLYNAAQNIDPESSYNNGNAQGLENFGIPTARSFGVNLFVRF